MLSILEEKQRYQMALDELVQSEQNQGATTTENRAGIQAARHRQSEI
jgi:hypothetical protein